MRSHREGMLLSHNITVEVILGKFYQFSVPILLSVTDTLLCLNEQKMTYCIRRDGFVTDGEDYCPSRLFNAFEPIRILGQTTKKKLQEKHDSWQAKHVILVTQTRTHISELIA